MGGRTMALNREEQLLKKIAVAMNKNPRGTTKDLAEAAGISKATLHRFCGSREHLIEMLTEQAQVTFKRIVMTAEEDCLDYKDGLRKLIQVHYENKEFLMFCCSIQSSIENDFWKSYMKALDDFFLRGQKNGDFKIEISIAILTEMFIAGISGLLDAMDRGRIASSGVEEVFEKFFLFGSAN